jgi:hypothetical protein
MPLANKLYKSVTKEAGAKGDAQRFPYNFLTNCFASGSQ